MFIPFDDVAQKMLKAGRLKNVSALARALGVTPQALSGYKRRRHLPAHLVVQFAKLYGLSLDWLIFGTEPVERTRLESPSITPEEGVAVFQTLKLLRTEGAISLVVRNMLDALYNEHIKEGVRSCKSA